MKTANSISGGKTSAYIAVHFPADYEVFSLVCIDDNDCAPKDKKLIQFVNDKLGAEYIDRYGEFVATAEDDDTLYALRDLEQFIGKEIIWVRGLSYDDVIDKPDVLRGSRTRLPSWARRYCTDAMKLQPIFEWWFNNVGDKVNMRLGFRYDEFDRMERFFNNSDPCSFSIPVACSTKGKRRNRHQAFNWRYCSFPLVKHGITKAVIEQYWNSNGFVGGNLFEDFRKIKFPAISNCVGCFHKKEETLAVMSELHPSKMNWFAIQENKGMGTWLDSRKTYAEIIEKRKDLMHEAFYELTQLGSSCDSGGCHD